MRWRQWLFIGMLLLSSCRKLLDVGSPIDNVTTNSAFNSDVTAAALMTGLYYDMSNGGAFMGSKGISYCCGLSADEFLLQQEEELSLSLYRNQIQTTVVPFWRVLYQYIYRVNATIEGLQAATKLTPIIRQQLMGEAKFTRAFCYFYLVNLFGDLPLVIGTDYKVNATLYRTSASKVYDLILADLRDAQELLRTDYLQADMVSVTRERIRPNKWAAVALKARIQLYLENWQEAINAATLVIDHHDLYDTSNITQVFQPDSREAIWQLQTVDKTFTDDAVLFIQQRSVQISHALLLSFEKGDLRRRYWLSGTGADLYPYKYKKVDGTGVPRENLVILRLGEQYLIRAEARLGAGDVNGAKADLDVIRSRSGLPGITFTTSDQLLPAIQQERRIELFAEWGHRWLDLKRTHYIDVVMESAAAAKSSSWASYAQWYPIPRSEIILNPHLFQNEGYHD
ncbi:RagB/SusD family nutrient uptake outer membrane protein [Chitinophaga pinensis]|uniref:RagB/SusD domain protein n=1 Tax=Chitinophaga pinensis (strain ATCC 43595 / DSM 2588 / LMG 13176 / NBRC 15968 / NCIMB 11800 / UQM 2034) TaxID=485918 RepID=A0A979GM09_CHIPD|nr:RagB/SusD family nutrient uptake outer membrane protein [Chitinophaga pinensis]ACU57562.1 RagB/SusD domain protein [Chitinophaga pinensis DSM 2588]